MEDLKDFESASAENAQSWETATAYTSSTA
jgi:hypothetical protein